MHAKDLFFVIPTYRLREVGETVHEYDEHFRRNGHTVRMSQGAAADSRKQSTEAGGLVLLGRVITDAR
jgi:hypothetical protein